MSTLDLDLLQSWEGREEINEDVITLPQVQMLASTLDHDPEEHLDGTILPPLYHWLYFLQPVKFSDLAPDGHAKKGVFMPPVPFPSRMFAGARIDYLGDLRIGERVQRTSTIQAVRYTEGRSGPLVFVTVAHKISNESSVALVEEQDIAYRPKTTIRESASGPETTMPETDFRRKICPNESLLFQFSALTFNSHRIHYDLPYARSEGYPALVVHGPLTAILLADLVARECNRPELSSFSFRARSPLYLGDQINLTGQRVENTVELTAFSAKGVASLNAQAVLR